ncbi:MAG: LptF/LptG family permease [Desulfurivibrionaceae bacterium]
MPFLLYSYILTETLIPFFASLLILGGILFLGQMLPLFEMIVELRVGLDDFLRLCFYLLPNLSLFAIPMASMLGVILCFNRMVADNEIVVLKSSGIGSNNLLPPVALFGLVTAAFTFYTGTALIPASTIATEKLLFKVTSEKFDQGLKEGEFSEGTGKIVFYIDRIAPDSNKWQGVYVSDMRDSSNPVIVSASSGRFKAVPDNLQLQVILEDGAIHYGGQDKNNNQVSETIQFEEYFLTMPLQYPQFLTGDKDTAFGKKGMTQEELLTFAEKHGPEDEETISKMIEYHKRLVLAVGCFLLTVLGLPLAVRSRPGARAVALPFSLLLFVFYYILLTGAKAAAESGMGVAISMWSPNILFGIFAVYLLSTNDKLSHEALLDYIFWPLTFISNQLKRFRSR